MVGGAGYIVHSLASLYAAETVLASAAIIMPAALTELALTGWLLLRGFNVQPATTPSHSPSELASTLGNLR
jgi:hypothetical protein